jgi:hypothetical protein
MPFFPIVADLHVAVNNTKPLSFVIETPEWDPFALFPNYKLFPTAVCNIKAPRSSSKVPDIPVQL